MSEGHRWAQKQMKEQNRKKIIKLLEKTPKRFKELLEESRYSPRGLSAMLKDLEKSKQIKKTIHDGREAYTITKSGQDVLRQIPQVAYILDTLDKGGVYHEDFSSIWGSMMVVELPWGITDNLLMDKNIDDRLNPFRREMVFELQEQLYNKIYENVKKRKTLINESLDCRLVLEISIDYKELVKSIKGNSLLHYKNMTDKEIDSFYKIDNGKGTEKDFELRKKIKDERELRLGLVKK